MDSFSTARVTMRIVKTTPANSTLPQWGLTWLNQVQCFYQHLCLVDSEVLRNPPLRQAAKRCRQAKKTKMKQIILTTIIISTLWSCDNQTKKEVSTEYHSGIKNKSKTQPLDSNLETGWHFKETKRDYIDSLLLDICSTQDFEVIDLYPVLDSISSDEYEKLLLVESLKSIGFKITNRARGNWMDGPRIVSFTMSNEQCECQVDKLYYSTSQTNKLKVTERVKCEKLK